MTLEHADFQTADELRRLVRASHRTPLDNYPQRAARLASSDPEFVDRYGGKWVATHGREFVAHESLEGLLHDLESAGITFNAVVIRFVEPADRALLL